MIDEQVEAAEPEAEPAPVRPIGEPAPCFEVWDDLPVSVPFDRWQHA